MSLDNDFIFENPLNYNSDEIPSLENSDDEDDEDDSKDESFCDKINEMITIKVAEELEEQNKTNEDKYKELGNMIKISLERYKYLKEAGLYDSD